ncbi:stage V sporulation protein S [Coprobacillus sp. CAG:826]|nr:stage V sporulation protein S [Coprobacillus sp. CAG:826]
MIQTMKVRKDSNVNAVAGSIANILREQDSIEVQTVGAGALNQSVKAITIARGFLAPSGIDLIITPSFQEVKIENEMKTAIRLKVEKRNM